MNLATFAGAYALFHATHGVADYWLQTDRQAQGKSKGNRLLGWLSWPLWSHIIVYSLCFIPALLLIGVTGPRLVGAVLAVGLPHAWMDRRRFLTWFCAKTKGWLPSDSLSPIEVAVRLHVTIAMDQKFHYLCLALLALLLSF